MANQLRRRGVVFPAQITHYHFGELAGLAGTMDRLIRGTWLAGFLLKRSTPGSVISQNSTSVGAAPAAGIFSVICGGSG